MPIPSRHRELIQEACGGQMFITFDRDRCLLIYPQPVWLEVEARINALSNSNPLSRKLKRMLVGNALPADLDSANRITIKQMHREYAGIDRKVVLIGQENKFELWDESRYQQKLAEWSTQDGDDEILPPDGELVGFKW